MERLSEPQYARFAAYRSKVSSRPESVLGVRMKHLRLCSKQLAALPGMDYGTAGSLLLPRAQQWYEYKIIYGGVMQRVASATEALPSLYDLCDGWAVPDYYREVLTHYARHGAREEVRSSIRQHTDSPNPYARRLSVVTWIGLIHYGLALPEEAFAHCLRMEQDEDYYVQMAVAWLLSVIAIAEPEETARLLHEHPLRSETVLRMFRQKMRDSLRTGNAPLSIFDEKRNNSI